jgi:hypothetical protein
MMPPHPAGGPKISAPLRAKTRHGPGLAGRGAEAGPRRLGSVETRRGGRSRHLSPAFREGRRRAGGLTGSRWASLAPVLGQDAPLASTTAHAHLGPGPRPWACDWTPALAPIQQAKGTAGYGVLPLTRTCSELAPDNVQPLLGGGRPEGTAMLRGRRTPSLGARPSPSSWRLPLHTGVVPPPERGASREQSRQHTGPEDHGARRSPRQNATIRSSERCVS